MTNDVQIYLEKAQESLAGAESERGNHRFNNCANRAYYACFQAAIAMLLDAGVPQPSSGKWRHEFVKAQFVTRFINRTKRYTGALRDPLERCSSLREAADYQRKRINQTEADHTVRRAANFVQTIMEGGESR